MTPRLPVLALSITAALLGGATLGRAHTAPAGESAVQRTAHADSGRAALARVARMAFGRSGALRVVVTNPGTPLQLPLIWAGAEPTDPTYRWVPTGGTRSAGLLGETRLANGILAPPGSGIWRLGLRGTGWSQEVEDLALITRVPFEHKQGGTLNGYRIGNYATEGELREDRYAPPAGFIEVTPENQDLRVSEHFRLRDFLTKDQFAIWPKYLALDLRLIDKLELVLQELNTMGIRAEHLAVMSGFRTPAYNGPGEGGRARLSRHTYGDASDVWVDNDRDGYIDDLNGDGFRDVRDAEVMLRAVDRVEQRYPELIGGAGVYLANSAHGPFIHIDTRGSHARW